MTTPSLPDAPLLARLEPALLRRTAAALVARPGDYGDLFLEKVCQVEIRRDDPRSGSVVIGGGCGAAARVLSAGGVRHVAAGGLGRGIVEGLPAMLRGGGGDRDRAEDGGEAPGPVAAGSASLPEATAIDDLVRYVDDLEDALMAIPGFAALGEGGAAGGGRPPGTGVRVRAEASTRRLAVVTSEGEIVEDQRAWATFTVRISLPGRGGRVLAAAAGGGARDAARLTAVHPPHAVAAGIGREIEEAGTAAPAPAGEIPVVLGPGIGGLLFHEACGHALEGDRAVRGRSAFAALLGERIGPPSLTLVDDPTIDGLPGSRRFDDEGWPARPTILIDAGRVAGLLLDRATALRTGSAPTGSARRESYRDLPLPRMTNTFVREGPHAPEEILAAVPRGLYVAELGSGWVDTASADFTFHVRRGYLIAGGRMVAPAGPCLVTGNGVRAIAGVRMIGDDLRFDPGAGECGKEGQRARAAVGQPTLLIEGLAVRPEGG